MKGQESIRFFIVALLLSGIIIGFVIIQLLERIVLKRLGNLSDEVTRIGNSGDLGTRIAVTGNDELASLAGAINGMLEAIEQFQESEERYVSLVRQLRAAHQQLTDILEFLPDATFVIDRQKRVIAWNQTMEEVSGVPKEEMIGQGDYAYAGPFYGERRPCFIDLAMEYDPDSASRYENFKRKGNRISAEAFVPSFYNGKGAYLLLTATALYDSAGNLVGAIESVRDISDRKEAEERQRYLSLHDALTDLYNRTHFEHMMFELGKDPSMSMGIILCDVDGLKIVNDTMGHDMGDKLLQAAAKVLVSASGEGDIAARIGGDEFAILLPNRDRHAVEAVMYRIRDAVEKYNRANTQLPLSISIGYETSRRGISLKEVFKEADNNMYREKLHHSQSNRSAIVQTLMKALEARDFITEGHADRLQVLVASMGTVLGLPEHKIADLRLLAQFHDIGKVGIPDRILFKQGPLTSEEYAEMQRHCEIGFRIAQSAPELVPIADWVLKHHERWDGKGYPLKLKGEEIPLECRILALADSYDAMTTDRPYRKAMSIDKVVTELKRCSGTQFDPDLVARFVELLEKGEFVEIANFEQVG